MYEIYYRNIKIDSAGSIREAGEKVTYWGDLGAGAITVMAGGRHMITVDNERQAI